MNTAASIPLIRPISDLRTHLNDVCNQAQESREPIIFTKNGTPSLVVMDSDAFEAMRQQDRIYLALREAEIEQKFTPGYLGRDEALAELREHMSRLGERYGA